VPLDRSREHRATRFWLRRGCDAIAHSLYSDRPSVTAARARPHIVDVERGASSYRSGTESLQRDARSVGAVLFLRR
jgi:hypothetical protein